MTGYFLENHEDTEMEVKTDLENVIAALDAVLSESYNNVGFSRLLAIRQRAEEVRKKLDTVGDDGGHDFVAFIFNVRLCICDFLESSLSERLEASNQRLAEWILSS
ncbi:hypothetical protein L0Y69_01785 [bacterium]|nr:hypothetical protein [bacterium]